MSGSGATCFALFSDRGAAHEARAALAATEPQWWCAAGGLVRREVVAEQALEFPVKTGKIPVEKSVRVRKSASLPANNGAVSIG
jgi:hypothetical protein